MVTKHTAFVEKVHISLLLMTVVAVAGACLAFIFSPPAHAFPNAPTWVLVRALPVNATVYLDEAACIDAITTPDLVCVEKP